MKPAIEIHTEEFLRDFNTLSDDFPEAFAFGMRNVTRTARDAGRMQTDLVFNLHTNYILKLIQNLPETPSQIASATKAASGYGDIRGAVYVRQGNGNADINWLVDHEEGRVRNSSKGGAIATPSTDLSNYQSKTSTGRTAKRWKPKTLLSYYNSVGPNIAGSKQAKGAPRTKRRGKPFIMELKNGKAAIVRRRSSNRHNLEFLYSFNDNVKIKPTWSFEQTVRASVQQSYVEDITKEINRIL